MAIQAAVIGAAIFIKLYRSWDKFSDAVTASRAKMLIYLGCGIVLFVAGYSLYPINPGPNNRAAIAGTLGVAVSAAGLFGILASVAPGIWRKALFSGIVA